MSPPVLIKCPQPGCMKDGIRSGEARNDGGEVTHITDRCPEGNVHSQEFGSGITDEDFARS
jgi:hypothetical protein